jgi:hypothetical protein
VGDGLVSRVWRRAAEEVVTLPVEDKYGAMWENTLTEERAGR